MTDHPADPIATLLRAGRSRHGVVTLDQARSLGISSGRLRGAVDRGLLTRSHPGVFVVAGAPPSWRQRLMVATEALGGVVSHRAAARLHRLDGASHAPVELTTAHSGSRLVHPYVVHRTRRFGELQVTSVDSVPVTTIARTIVDLGLVVDDDTVEQVLDDALRRGINMRWITETLSSAGRPGNTGLDALERVMARPDRAGPLPDSVFERLLERLIAEHALPAPNRQVVVDLDGGSARLDAAWPDLMVGLEADSEMWHYGPRRGRLARRRHNRLTAHGWTMLYASWQDTRDPAELVSTLRPLLRRQR